MAITEFQIFRGICSVFWLKRCSPCDSVFDPPVGGHLYNLSQGHQPQFQKGHSELPGYIYIYILPYIYIYKITCLFGVFTCALVGRLSMPLREVPVDSDMIQVAGGVNSKVGSFSSKCHHPNRFQ